MLNLTDRLVSLLLVITFLTAPLQAEPVPMTWDKLAPAQVEIVNPFDSLTGEQLDALRKIVRLEWMDQPEKQAEAVRLRADLGQQGLDVDGLLTARLDIMELHSKAASAINQEIIGREIRIPGYVLPLEMNDLKTAVVEGDLENENPFPGLRFSKPTIQKLFIHLTDSENEQEYSS